MSSIVVKKFGGAGLSSIEKVKAVAKHLKNEKEKGHSVLAVVSAMGKTTDELIQKAYAISPHPDRRELDMLISTGERVSMSLLTLALKDLGCDAISFTGSQAGVLTNESHSSATIVDLKPIRVEEAIQNNQIVVVAGFQGVDPKTKEITTLGRGGTDTTAVAFASHFKAKKCEIIKEVDGIYTADPNLIPEAKHIPEINYDTLLHMCTWGAKALHYRCVEMAKEMNIPIWVGHLNSKTGGTLCSQNGKAKGVNILTDIYRMNGDKERLAQALKAKNWQEPQYIKELISKDNFYICGSQNIIKNCEKVCANQNRLENTPLAALTVSGETQLKGLDAIESISHVNGITVIIEQQNLISILQKVHRSII